MPMDKGILSETHPSLRESIRGRVVPCVLEAVEGADLVIDAAVSASTKSTRPPTRAASILES